MAFPKYVVRRDLNWNFESEPEPYLNSRRIEIPRGKGLGGSTMINGMVYARGHRRDYDDWARRGLPGWGYADVLPYFRKSERSWLGENLYHGGSGEMEIAVPKTNMLYDELRAASIAAGVPATEDYHGEQTEKVSKWWWPTLTVSSCYIKLATFMAGDMRTTLLYMPPCRSSRPRSRAASSISLARAGARAAGLRSRTSSMACIMPRPRTSPLRAFAGSCPSSVRLARPRAAEIRRERGRRVEARPILHRDNESRVGRSANCSGLVPSLGLHRY